MNIVATHCNCALINIAFFFFHHSIKSLLLPSKKSQVASIEPKRLTSLTKLWKIEERKINNAATNLQATTGSERSANDTSVLIQGLVDPISSPAQLLQQLKHEIQCCALSASMIPLS